MARVAATRFRKHRLCGQHLARKLLLPLVVGLALAQATACEFKPIWTAEGWEAYKSEVADGLVKLGAIAAAYLIGRLSAVWLRRMSLRHSTGRCVSRTRIVAAVYVSLAAALAIVVWLFSAGMWFSAILAMIAFILARLRRAPAVTDVSKALDFDNEIEVMQSIDGLLAKVETSDTLSYLNESVRVFNSRTGRNTTVAHHAASLPQPELLRFLIANHVQVDAPDEKGLTPLHYAAGLGHAEHAEILVRGGASLDAATPEQRITPLHVAATEGRAEVVSTLARLGAKLDPPALNGIVPLHCSLQSIPCLDALLASGANVQARADNGMTALHAASKAGTVNAIRRLVSAGAAVDDQDQYGWTPLHHALAANRPDLVQALVELGANADLADANGRTPRQIMATPS